MQSSYNITYNIIIIIKISTISISSMKKKKMLQKKQQMK